MRKLISSAIVVGGMLAFCGVASAADQPHMDAALAALENAKSEILAADQYHDHGGHAGSATNLIEQAIHQVREGIRYRNEHGK